MQKEDVRTCGRGHEEEERRESAAEVEEVVELKIGYVELEIVEEEEEEEQKDRGTYDRTGDEGREGEGEGEEGEGEVEEGDGVEETEEVDGTE